MSAWEHLQQIESGSWNQHAPGLLKNTLHSRRPSRWHGLFPHRTEFPFFTSLLKIDERLSKLEHAWPWPSVSRRARAVSGVDLVVGIRAEHYSGDTQSLDAFEYDYISDNSGGVGGGGCVPRWQTARVKRSVWRYQYAGQLLNIGYWVTVSVYSQEGSVTLLVKVIWWKMTWLTTDWRGGNGQKLKCLIMLPLVSFR